MSMKFTTVPSKRLAASITGSSSAIQLNNITGWDGEDVVAGDFGTRLFAVLRNDANTLMEIIELDPSTIANSSITVLKRGLQFDGDLSTEVADNKLTWIKNETIVELGAVSPQLLNHVVQIIGAQTIAGLKIFSTVPQTSGGDPVDDNDVARKAYVDAAVSGSFPANRIVVSGTAGETVAAGDMLYFDTTDDEWKLADADAAATSENVLLGVAQGAGTDGTAITNGILLVGLDSNQTGLNTGDVQYLSDTAGEISTTPGTKNVVVGIAKSATELYFSPRFALFLTKDQQDALGGTSGTPSASNKYVTADDVSETVTASKIVRRDSNGEIAGVNKIQLIDQTAGMDISGAATPVPVFYGKATGDRSSAGLANGSFASQLVDTTQEPVYVDNWEAQTFLLKAPYTSIDKVQLSLSKTGSPTIDYYLDVYATSAGEPTGSALQTSDAVASAGVSTEDWHDFDFSTPVELEPEVTYAFVLRTAGGDVSNHLRWHNQGTDVYADGTRVASTDAGSTWSISATNDLKFIASGTTHADSYGKLFVSSDEFMESSDFIGFVTDDFVTDDADVLVQTKGIIAGFTGLTAGADYFVNDDGTIDTSGNLYIGRAISATEIYIDKEANERYIGSIALIVTGNTDLRTGVAEMPKHATKAIMQLNFTLTGRDEAHLFRKGKTSGVSAAAGQGTGAAQATCDYSISGDTITVTSAETANDNNASLSGTVYFYY